MGLDIEALLNLNRLRDKKIQGTGVIKKVEICTNPNKVLKETENYTYKTVEVLDGALIDLDNKGIVDEIVRMTFHDEEYEKSTCDYQRVNGRWRRLEGFYLRYKQTDDSHPFNTLFRTCEKAYFNRFKNKNGGKKNSEEYFEEDHRSQARLLTFEILCGENERFNKSFNKTFNFDLRNIDDFKYILYDLELAADVRKYITQAIANEANNVAFRGRNSDYVYGYKKVKGKHEKFSRRLNTLYLDQKYSDNEECDGYTFIKMQDGVYADSSTHSALTFEEKKELKDEDNLYRYLLQNIDKILTDKQLLYLKAYLNNDDISYLSTLTYDRKTQLTYRSTYKKRIIEYIKKYLDKDIHSRYVNNKVEFKKSLLVSLENILKQSSNKDIFTTLCKYLKEESNNVLEHVLIDVIYSLDYKYYAPIVSYINSNTINDSYIENDFLIVIKAIQKAYNHHSGNNDVVYNLNRNNKELTVENFIKKILGNSKEGVIAESKGEHGLITRTVLKDFISGVEERKVLVSELNDILNKYGYCITKSSTSVNNTRVFKVYVKGYEPQVRSVDRDYNKVNTYNITKEQSNIIEKFIDSRLKLNVLIRTTKNHKELRLEDVKLFVQDTLNIKKLTIKELAIILKDCNYLLDLKRTVINLNKVAFNASRIKKLKD